MILKSHFKRIPEAGKDKEPVKQFSFAGAAVSDIGCIRFRNEDNYILGGHFNGRCEDYSEVSRFHANAGWEIAGVFDGMGGGEKGELAARDAAHIFLEAFRRMDRTSGSEDIDRCLRQAFLTANNQVIALQRSYRVFGTTGTVLCANGKAFKIYHLGDSRAYLLRDGELLPLTRDQTLAQMKLEAGMYREEDPAMEEDKHKLTEYIGRDRTQKNIKPVESQWIPIREGDRVLLCSDGLYDMCCQKEIKSILRQEASAYEAAAALVKQAVCHGGEDNVTCLCIDFTG